MKRFLFVVGLMAAGLALAQTAFSVTETHTTGTVTCTSLDAGAGASLSNALGYAVTVSTVREDAGTQVFHSGTYDCCVYAPVTANNSGVVTAYRWVDCPSSLDFSLSACANKRDCTSGDFQPLVGVGRVAYVPSSVAVDGGTQVKSTITVRRR